MPKAKKEEKEVSTDVKTPKEYGQEPTNELIDQLIDDLEPMMVERINLARETMLKIVWETGQTLREAEQKNKVSITAMVSMLAKDSRMSGRQMGERNIWFAIKVFDTYPKFNDILDTPEYGQNISVSKLKKLLVKNKPKIAEEPDIREISLKLYDKLGKKGCKALIAEIQRLMELMDKKID